MTSPLDRDLEETYGADEFVAELRRLADAIEAEGGFEIELDGERVVLPDDVEYSIEFDADDGEAELSLQIVWTYDAVDEDDDEDWDEEDDEADDEEWDDDDDDDD